jgi:hypothetical protein
LLLVASWRQVYWRAKRKNTERQLGKKERERERKREGEEEGRGEKDERGIVFVKTPVVAVYWP